MNRLYQVYFTAYQQGIVIHKPVKTLNWDGEEGVFNYGLDTSEPSPEYKEYTTIIDYNPLDYPEEFQEGNVIFKDIKISRVEEFEPYKEGFKKLIAVYQKL